jgi:hypothetical protein
MCLLDKTEYTDDYNDTLLRLMLRYSPPVGDRMDPFKRWNRCVSAVDPRNAMTPTLTIFTDVISDIP